MVQTALPPADQIKKNIFDRFYWDSRINYSNIGVEVHEGKVTLLGSVPTALARKHAEAAAAAVPGVRSVSNQLAVKFSDALTIPSDLEVETKVRDILHWNSNIDDSKITVAVNGGFATLEGTVESYYQKFRAQELAEDVIGVTKIDNRLTVVPTVLPADEEVAQRIIAALRDKLSGDSRSLTVMVRNGVVTLTGTVPDALAFQAAENIVCHVRGIVDFHNHLEINWEGQAPMGVPRARPGSRP